LSYLLDTNDGQHTQELLVDRQRTQPCEQPCDHPKVGQRPRVLRDNGEIRNGVERLDDHPRRERLRLWLERDLPDLFGDRLLGVTAMAADRWGRLRAEVRRSVPTTDSLLAATVLQHDLRLVTRNERDFRGYPGLLVVNPWKA
jgi:predicted nucleic acid-binding protein